MKFVRMQAGRGDVLLAEGDPTLADDEERLIAEFRRQLDLGMWAAASGDGELGNSGGADAVLVRDFAEIPPGTERVIFFPAASGG